MNKTVQQIIKEFGDDVIPTDDSVSVISTSSLSLDVALGVGGIPRGKITEIYGPEGTAKTTLGLEICKNAIGLGLKAFYVDVENMLDLSYAKAIVGEESIKNGFFTVAQPTTAEEAFKICELVLDSNDFSVIIFDSVGALAPVVEQEDEFEKASVAIVPRLISKFLRRNSGRIRKNKVSFVFLNQVRDKIGSYVQGYNTPGGHALKHFSSVIIALSKGKDIEIKKDKVGTLIRFIVKKNKLAPPFRAYAFPLIFGEGIDELWDFVDFATTVGVIKQAASFFKFEDVTLGQGVKNTKDYLEANPETLDKIRKMVYNITTKYAMEVSNEPMEEADEQEGDALDE